MPFKINISDKGKAWKLESTSEEIAGKKIGDSIEGASIAENLSGYTLKITGASDTSGFPHSKDINGPEVKRAILNYGWGMHKRPRKAGKKPTPSTGGLRLRKTLRGNQISDKTSQINMIVVKHGASKLAEIFPDQNKPKEAPAPAENPPAQ